MREKLITTEMRLLLIIVSAAVAFFLVLKGWRVLMERSLARADQLELGATFDRWNEAGRPDGERLLEFMKGRNPSLSVSNRSINISGQDFTTQFASTQSRSGWEGTLFVTTNRVLIWLNASGQPEIVSHK